MIKDTVMFRFVPTMKVGIFKLILIKLGRGITYGIHKNK